jgi:hypothetical protein
MERVAADIEGLHLGIADLDAFLVGALVENAFDLESRLGCGCRNRGGNLWTTRRLGRPNASVERALSDKSA